MLDTLKMWLFGLPYALYQTQRRKVAVDRFWNRESHWTGTTIDSNRGIGLPLVSPLCSDWVDYGLSGQKIYVLPEWFDDPRRWN